MTAYSPIYTPVFQKRLGRYFSLSLRIKNQVLSILQSPYLKTEPLQRELKGLRSARIGRNFRIIFAISEEIKNIGYARDVFPQFCRFPDDTIIFITIGPHEKAYKLK